MPPANKLKEFYRRKFKKNYIVSFPKSGRTWLRMLIGKSLQLQYGLEEKEINDLNRLTALVSLPRIKLTHDSDPHKVSIDQIKNNKRRYKWHKTLFLTRDPRDIMVSLYFHETKRTGNFSGTLKEFLRQEDNPLDKMIKFFNIWGKNLSEMKNTYLLTYEEMSNDTSGVLRDVLRFMDLPRVDDHIIGEAVDYCTFSNMRKMEASKSFDVFWLKPSNEEDSQSFKTREGKVNSYVKYMDREDIELINSKLSNELKYFTFLI